MRKGGIYLEQEPITRGKGVSTCSRHQSHEGRGNLPEAGTNHMREGGIYLEQKPITGGKG